jgi:hypothetical protein
MASPPTDNEPRSDPRRPVMRRALILLSPTEQIDCVVRNISRTGAMVSVDKPVQLPPRFVLDMSGNIVVKRLCDLVWQDGMSAGVTFSKLRGFQAIQFNLD